MGILKNLVDFVLHLDKNLSLIIQSFGAWTYFILFLIIFAETGLVVAPFLPGDSLLFAAGSFAAIGSLNVFWLFVLLSFAAILGDTINYSLGKFIGPKVFHERKSRYFNKEHLERTHRFYEKYGAKTIILARFVPVIRTFAPFVAGIGRSLGGAAGRTAGAHGRQSDRHGNFPAARDAGAGTELAGNCATV